MAVVLCGITVCESFPGEAVIASSVRLEWRPLQAFVALDGTVDIGLFAVSNTGEPITIRSAQVILRWDSSRLGDLEIIDACAVVPCRAHAYPWIFSGFPSDANVDGLNNSIDDGNALYRAEGRTDPELNARVTAEGLWLTSFRFRAKALGAATLQMETSIGTSTRTSVTDPALQSISVTLGPAARMTVVDCPAPAVAAVGSRYVAITPVDGQGAVALRVDGLESDWHVACVSRFVQGDGHLDRGPVFFSPAQWGTVYVADAEIIPSALYSIFAVCRIEQGVDVQSSSVDTATWRWGDVTGDGELNVLDVSYAFDAAAPTPNFHGGIPENYDVIPCAPDGIVDDDDFNATLAANHFVPFPCPFPCGSGPDLTDFSQWLGCMMGPGSQIIVDCMPYDGNADGVVDLIDFADFAIRH